MKYFAYGSNMFHPRLISRTPSAVRRGVFFLAGHTLQFHKIGKDGSAKCNAYYTGGETDLVEGIVYDIDAGEIDMLDRAEGLGQGYEKKKVTVDSAEGESVDVFSYFATQINDSLRPFSWYKKHVVEGAQRGGLSDDYIAKIKYVLAIKDPDAAREQRELKIHEP